MLLCLTQMPAKVSKILNESLILETATTDHLFVQKLKFINYLELDVPIEA